MALESCDTDDVVRAAFAACKLGRLSLWLLLGNDVRFEQTGRMLGRLFVEAVQGGHVKMVDTLLVDPRLSSELGTCLLEAVFHGANTAILDRILSDPRQNPSWLDEVAGCGQLLPMAEHVALLLLRDEQACDHTKVLAVLLCSSSAAGFTGVVTQILEQAAADPGAFEHRALELAMQHGHHAIVELLLVDPRTDPGPHSRALLRTAEHKDSMLAQYAMRTADFSLLDRLLSDPRASEKSLLSYEFLLQPRGTP